MPKWQASSPERWNCDLVLPLTARPIAALLDFNLFGVFRIRNTHLVHCTILLSLIHSAAHIASSVFILTSSKFIVFYGYRWILITCCRMMIIVRKFYKNNKVKIFEKRDLMIEYQADQATRRKVGGELFGKLWEYLVTKSSACSSLQTRCCSGQQIEMPSVRIYWNPLELSNRLWNN